MRPWQESIDELVELELREKHGCSGCEALVQMIPIGSWRSSKQMAITSKQTTRRCDLQTGLKLRSWKHQESVSERGEAQDV